MNPLEALPRISEGASESDKRECTEVIDLIVGKYTIEGSSFDGYGILPAQFLRSADQAASSDGEGASETASKAETFDYDAHFPSREKKKVEL